MFVKSAQKLSLFQLYLDIKQLNCSTHSFYSLHLLKPAPKLQRLKVTVCSHDVFIHCKICSNPLNFNYNPVNCSRQTAELLVVSKLHSLLSTFLFSVLSRDTKSFLVTATLLFECLLDPELNWKTASGPEAALIRLSGLKEPELLLLQSCPAGTTPTQTGRESHSCPALYRLFRLIKFFLLTSR